MSDDEWFAAIEVNERQKRRQDANATGVASILASLCSIFCDLRDSFSLPKGAYIKYAR